jgi:hypothetical protein
MINCDCSIDIDSYPDFFVSKIMKARKSHKCCECKQEIKQGEKYEKVTGKWDGEISTVKTCYICTLIREDYCPHGYEFGRLREILWECLGIDYVTCKLEDEEDEVEI